MYSVFYVMDAPSLYFHMRTPAFFLELSHLRIPSRECDIIASVWIDSYDFIVLLA